MFLGILGAIALAMGSTMTVNDLASQEAYTALDDQQPIVAVAQVQRVEDQASEIGW